MKSEYQLTFAENLKRLLNEKELTQTAFANYLSLSRQAISKYACGENQPTLTQLLKIAEFFNISIDELLTGKKPENKPIRESLGLSEQAIENLKEIKDNVVVTDNDKKISLLPLLDNILSDEKLFHLLQNISAWQMQIKNNLNFLNSFMKEETNDFTNYLTWRLVNIISEFFISNIKDNLKFEYENAIDKAKNIACSI